MLSLDTDGDGDRDLLFTEESCATIYRMENLGTTAAPVMNNLEPFPLGNPVGMPYYPSPYWEDVDHDGVKDLLIGLNLSSRADAYTDFASSLWRYRNAGSDASPVFVFEEPNFLQSGMVEFGDLSAPALADIDHDGDLDLLVGAFLDPVSVHGVLTLYQNIGTSKAPHFEWITNDFGQPLLLLDIQYASAIHASQPGRHCRSCLFGNGRWQYAALVHSVAAERGPGF